MTMPAATSPPYEWASHPSNLARFWSDDLNILLSPDAKRLLTDNVSPVEWEFATTDVKKRAVILTAIHSKFRQKVKID
jgi:hypothetical protein